MASLSVEQHRTLLDHAPAMIWRAGVDAGRDFFNAAWLAYRGRSHAQEAGNGWTEGIHPDGADACLAAYREGFERRQPFDLTLRLRRFDGVYRTVLDRVTPYADPSGAFGGFVGSCVDVDDHRVGPITTTADDFFEMALDNACVAGLDGYFKRLNPSWSRTLGWTPDELMSRPSIDFVHPDDRETVLSNRRKLQAGLPMPPLVNRYRCRDGSYRWLEWRSVANPERGLVYAVARDVTEQKQAEERLREAKELQEKLQRQLVFADRMASVGTLAAGVAHEINNPLAWVTVNVKLIHERLATGEATPGPAQLAELREIALEAAVGVERIRKIVQGLKTFSRAEQERRSLLDVRRVLELALDMTCHEFRHRARLVKELGAVPLVEADDARLGQVFINLLLNATHALPERDAAENELRVLTSTDAGGHAVVEIRDTGVGIPAHLLDRVFDPFFTTKPVGKGTGLGLFICHNIVTGLGGELSVASEEGRGSTFRIVLPAAR